MEKKVKVWCKDCKHTFEIDADMPIGRAVPGHTWSCLDGDTVIRELTDEDHMEELADKEICPECGVPHGNNPYTGCGVLDMNENITFGVWEDPNKAFVKSCPKCHVGMYEASDIDTENDEITYYYVCPECGHTSD